MCEYAYYDEKENSNQRLYCKINGKPCLYSKYCVKAGKFIPNDNGMENCFMALENKKTIIPNGANYVRFIRKGFIYVELDNRVIKVKSDTIGNAEYVYLRMKDGRYEASLEPFIEEVNDVETENIDNTDIDDIENTVETDTVDSENDDEEEKEVETEEEEVIKPKKKRTYKKRKKTDD